MPYAVKAGKHTQRGPAMHTDCPTLGDVVGAVEDYKAMPAHQTDIIAVLDMEGGTSLPIMCWMKVQDTWWDVLGGAFTASRQQQVRQGEEDRL